MSGEHPAAAGPGGNDASEATTHTLAGPGLAQPNHSRPGQDRPSQERPSQERPGFVRVDDQPGARAVLRDRGFAPIDLAAYLGVLRTHSGRDLGTLEHLARNIPFFLEGERHLKLHTLAAGFFGTRHIAPWRATVEALVERALEGLQGRDAVELMGDFIEPLFQAALGRVMGLAIADHPGFVEWTRQTRTLLEPLQSVRRMERLQAAIRELMAEVNRAEPLHTPGCPPPFLAQVMAHLDADFDRDDAVALSTALLVAGQTTSQTLGNILVALLQGPAERRTRAADPAWVAQHLETLLRLHASPQFIDRQARTDREAGGCPFRAGDHVQMHLPTINRDPQVFPEDDRAFEDGARAIGHLGFGSGIHKCPGAAFARLVIEAVLPRLFARYPGLRLGLEPPQWIETTFIRAPQTLPCFLQPENPS